MTRHVTPFALQRHRLGLVLLAWMTLWATGLSAAPTGLATHKLGLRVASQLPLHGHAKFCKVLEQLRQAAKTDFKGYVGGKKNPPQFWASPTSTYFAAKLAVPGAKTSHIEVMTLDAKWKYYIYQGTFYEGKDAKVAQNTYAQYRLMLVDCMPAEMKMQQDYTDNEGSIMTFKGPGAAKNLYTLVELVNAPGDKPGSPRHVCIRVAQFPVQ